MCIRISSFRQVQLELNKKTFWLFQALSLQWVGVTTDRILNMDIFLTKTHRFATGGLYLRPGAE